MKKLIILLMSLFFLLNCSESTAPENVFNFSDEIIQPLSKTNSINKTSSLDFVLTSPNNYVTLTNTSVTFTWEKFDEDFSPGVDFGRYFIEINGTLYPGSSNENDNNYTKTLINNKHYVWKVFAEYYKYGNYQFVEYNNSREFIIGIIPSKIYGWWGTEGNGSQIPEIDFSTYMWPYHSSYELFKSVDGASYTSLFWSDDDAGWGDMSEIKWDEHSPPKIVTYKVKSSPGGLWSNVITFCCNY